MPSYRAAIFRDPYSDQKTVLTGPDIAYVGNAALIEAAVAEAHDRDLIGEEPPMVTEFILRQNLFMGEAQIGEAPAQRPVEG